MDSENHTFLQAVRLPHGELWQSRDGDLVYSGEGDVQILYSRSLDKFILRLHEFKTVLDKSLPVISSIVGRHQRQAFLLPRGIGFTMIRLPEGKSTPALENFETILENTTNFSRRSNVDPTLATFKEIKESALESLLTSVSKVFGSIATDSHPNQKVARTFDEIKDLDSHGTSVVDLNGGEIESLTKRNELDSTGSNESEIWKSFMGQGTYAGFPGKSGESQTKEGHQHTSEIANPTSSNNGTELVEKGQTHKYHPSIDHQEVVGAQEQRLPAYEVHNSKEFLQENLQKASGNVQPGEGDEQADKPQENTKLPDPVNYDDEAFTFGLLNKDHTQAKNTGIDKEAPICNEDAFTDLTHPMRKFSLVDRPFLNIDDESEPTEAEKPKPEPHVKGFAGQPIITAKGQPTLKSNIDDQPSPIPNTEKYSEPAQPEKSSFARSNDSQPIKQSTNIVRESSHGSESKKQRKVQTEAVDKENANAPTAV